jgi:hypothetical protein
MHSFLINKKVFIFLFFIIGIIALRSLMIPLLGDEITYFKIGGNILEGKYYQTENPSSVIPVLPFLMAFFKVGQYPMVGFALQKLFHITLTLIGFRFAYLTLKKIISQQEIILSILLLTAVSTGVVSWLSSLYPEPIIFVCFWGFIYYINEEKNIQNFKRLFILFILLTFTRYLYAILGLIVLIYYYQYYFDKGSKNFLKVIIYSVIITMPLLFWFKYVYNIETQNLSEISYFTRFKAVENPLWYNIKCGLGIEKSFEVKRVNGIPAFISLFVPIAGIRNFPLSLFLLSSVFVGLFFSRKNKIVLTLLLAFSCSLLGLILAGTGFSRYWLSLLPIVYLGYYYIYIRIVKDPKYFILGAQLISVGLIMNEIRITIMIFKQYL